MMFKEPEQFEFEFIERTLDIIQKYNGEYELTLFINSMVGLFVIPKEKHYDELDDSMMDSNLLAKIKLACIDKSIKPDGELSLQHISRRMRNAISHGHIRFEAAADPYGRTYAGIERVCFFDDKNQEKKKLNYQSYEFTAKIDVNLLKEFVVSFANAVKDKCSDIDSATTPLK